MIPRPDVLGVEGCKIHISTRLTLLVEKRLQEARAEPILLEELVNCEKCDMGVFKSVTTQIAEEKADEIAILCIDADALCVAGIPAPPRRLEIGHRCSAETLYKDFARRLEIGHLQRLNTEASLPESHCYVLVNQTTGRARFNFMTLKVGIFRALYDELNKIVKNDGADSAAADAESYFLTRREAVGWLPRWRLLNDERLLLPLPRGSYICVNIIVTLKRHACYI